MKKPLYNQSDRHMLRFYPEFLYSKNIFLEMRKKHLLREIERIIKRLNPLK